MIILSEVAVKLSKILNGLDTETSGITNPTNFYFEVQTTGFHLDSIADKATGKNAIYVFVDSMGGQFNPVKKLKQASYSIPLSFFFPIRFKKDFFHLCEFLEEVFVGTSLDYGEVSGRAVSNIGVPTFSEIVDQDLKEFKKWSDNVYEKAMEVMEPYLAMNLTLFLSNAAEGVIFGNDVQAGLSFTYNGNTYSVNDLIWDGSSIQSNCQPQSEQEEGTDETDSLPFGTSYGSSIKIYPDLTVKATESTTEHPIYFYKELLKIWLEGHIQEVECELTITFAGDQTLQYQRKCFIQSVVAPVEKGAVFYMTLTFAKLYEEEEVEE